MGAVRGDGFAKERDDIDDLTSKLLSNEGVSVVPHEQKRDGADGDYPFKFDLDVAWRPVKKELKSVKK